LNDPAVCTKVAAMSKTPAAPIPAAPPLLQSQSGGVLEITLNQPGTRNALGLAMIEALHGALADAGGRTDVRAIVIAGVGPAFSAGHNLREIDAHRSDPDGGAAFFQEIMARCSDLMQAVTRLPQPVIAAVEGVATAAGCQLVAACDLAIAGAGARFATPGVNIGLFCSTPLVAVGRAVSRKHAMEMALTGALYSAEDAERFGLVNRVVPAGEALAQARQLAQELAARSAATLALGKRAFYQQIERPLGEAYALASQVMVENLKLADSREGIGAFLEKREPKWAD
jgi:enoyl-CoA hydratase/carnithine racemase